MPPGNTVERGDVALERLQILLSERQYLQLGLELPHALKGSNVLQNRICFETTTGMIWKNGNEG